MCSDRSPIRPNNISLSPVFFIRDWFRHQHHPLSLFLLLIRVRWFEIRDKQTGGRLISPTRQREKNSRKEHNIQHETLPFLGFLSLLSFEMRPTIWILETPTNRAREWTRNSGTATAYFPQHSGRDGSEYQQAALGRKKHPLSLSTSCSRRAAQSMKTNSVQIKALRWGRDRDHGICDSPERWQVVSCTYSNDDRRNFQKCDTGWFLDRFSLSLLSVSLFHKDKRNVLMWLILFFHLPQIWFLPKGGTYAHAHAHIYTRNDRKCIHGVVIGDTCGCGVVWCGLVWFVGLCVYGDVCTGMGNFW